MTIESAILTAAIALVSSVLSVVFVFKLALRSEVQTLVRLRDEQSKMADEVRQHNQASLERLQQSLERAHQTQERTKELQQRNEAARARSEAFYERWEKALARVEDLLDKFEKGNGV